MAFVSSRALPRVLNLHTTLTLRPHARTPTARTITSFQGLQGQPQPWLITKVETQEKYTPTFMDLHLESLSVWHTEAEALQQIRILPTDADDTLKVSFRDQVTEMLDEMVEENLLDVRHGWMHSTKF
ncbi:uncharacterized protein LOC121868060 [Homarus americanus]|uniref:Uncharacterized protein n=1 Tax=Homarus americanus TaxID=6706 RepID=A0A8J5MY40_HOMAM|nr:uncharacterized protein LOC121868060 [Homarus americanus]KAG7167692.1 hypothetical protein Hamer_G020576 [Homarus americanus]